MSNKTENVAQTKNPIIPTTAWITVNRNCNMRCEWCYAKKAEYQGEMDFEYAKKLASLVFDFGVKKLIIIGGEPTLWSHLLQFNAFCRNLGLMTVLATNAMRFSNDAFWEKYKKDPNDSVGISLKGYDAKTYKNITGISDYASVVKGIKRSVVFFEHGVSTIYNSPNPKDLIGTALLAKEVGATFLSIGFCTPVIQKGCSDGTFLTPLNQVVKSVLAAYDEVDTIMEQKLSFSMKLPLCLWPDDFIDMLIGKKQLSTLCQLRQKFGLIFSMYGEVIMCNSLLEYPIGAFEKDFSTKDELLAFLNTPRISGYYDNVNNYPSEKCISCKRYSSCGGGCPILWSFHSAQKTIVGY